MKILNEYQELWSASSDGTVNSNALQKMLFDRLRLSKKAPDINGLDWDEKDAVENSNLIRKEFDRRIDFAKNKVGQETASKVEAQLTSMLEDLRILVHSEMLAAIRDRKASR